MVSAEAPTWQCQNSQMKDLVVFESHCRYFAILLWNSSCFLLSFQALLSFLLFPSFFLPLDRGNEGELSCSALECQGRDLHCDVLKVTEHS